ncbi:hypothetical protein [Arthrobacter sp. PsM3]|uniref:hypothetical protein n=1 Tax=Arthrobacter sp. PsM3 TaxID=3030531 RepID=UPI00263A5A87|nr:hypothetical protein [Arthrobacter sp. PsM3]MDN4645360.1 hypothetical protein [Arthrobacter sp. PsM3]
MAEGVKFPDVPQLVCNYLRKPLLTGIPIGTKVPPTRPPEFIRVLRTGGTKETVRSEAAQITIEAWAQDEARAADLLSTARAILNAADGQLFGVREFGGPANLPDPTTAQIRFTMSFQIRARGTAVTV